MNGCEIRDSSANGAFHPNNSDYGHAPLRKRCWHQSRGRGSPPDHSGGACHVKLYVSPVPRTVTEAEIRCLFDGHGTIAEVVLLKDRKHGGQQVMAQEDLPVNQMREAALCFLAAGILCVCKGYFTIIHKFYELLGSCFVKYTNLEGADRAIRALCNQYTFHGEPCPITVKYADGEIERLGIIDKVFVNGFHREASRKQIEEIFSAYGHVEEVFICRNELKQSRGYGFVQFTHREMALAAIDGLHEKFTMPGCSQPFIVRFASPKKPKTGDLRQAPIYSDPKGGVMAPNHFTVLQPHVPIHLENSPSSTGMMQQTFQPKHSLPQWPPVPLQPMQMQHLGSQPAAELRQSNQIYTNAQNMDQLKCSQMASSPPTGVIQDVIVTSQDGLSPECDWSEHTCPDGYKYYYNCTACESRWEKPEEYVSYEQQIRKQQHVLNLHHQLQSPLSLLSPEKCTQTQKEPECVQLQPETSSVIGPTCSRS